MRGGRSTLHQAIAGAAHGGVGPGVGPKTALSVGREVDVDALAAELIRELRRGRSEVALERC